MKARPIVLALAGWGLLLAAQPALAFTIFDVAGIGFVCTYNPDGSQSCQSGVSFTGTVTIDVNPAGPSGIDSGGDGTSIAFDSNGWVSTSFDISWAGGSYQSAAVSGQTSFDQYADVMNGYGNLDRLYSRFLSDTLTSTEYRRSLAVLERRTTDLSWLSGLAFPEAATLAPVTGAVNLIDFRQYGYSRTTSGSAYDWTGFRGGFNLTSMVARTAAVPEPAALALLGLGLAGLGVARRRKRS